VKERFLLCGKKTFVVDFVVDLLGTAAVIAIACCRLLKIFVASIAFLLHHRFGFCLSC